MPDPERRLRILTRHLRDNRPGYPTRVPPDFHLATDAARSTHHLGRVGTLAWGDNVQRQDIGRFVEDWMRPPASVAARKEIPA